MTTTHDDNATSWRDLSDQLTPQQIAEMEYCEREGIPPGLNTPQHQLNCARAMARHNIIQALCADIAPPSDASGSVYHWEAWGGGGYGRMYEVSSTRVGGNMLVDILGVQHDNGDVERFILADLSENDRDGNMNAVQARQLAAALIEAADEMDRLAAATVLGL
jgi:hypothetical protein